jgi:hypothetical protein
MRDKGRVTTRAVFLNTTLKFAKPVPPTWGRPDYLYKAMGSKPQMLDGGKTVVFATIFHEESKYPSISRRPWRIGSALGNDLGRRC